MPLKIDLTGRKFNKLTVIKESKTRAPKNSSVVWLCKCDCCNYKKVPANNLKNNNTKSCGCINKFNPKWSLVNRVFQTTKAGAYIRRITFDLTLENINSIIFKDCIYCGSEPSNNQLIHEKVNIKYNGIDRLNNKLGYTKRNCVPCCYACNRAKSDFTLNEWYSWLDRIVRYRC